MQGDPTAVEPTAPAADGGPAFETIADPGSSDRYRQLFHLSPDAATSTRLSDDRIVESNARAEVLYGYSREDLMGSDVGSSLWADSAEREAFRDEARRKGEVRDFPFRLQRRSGEIIHAEISSRNVLVDGAPCLLAVTKDVSARHAAERALRASERRYRAVVESQSELVVRWLPDGTRTFVNEAYCRYFGGAKGDHEGESFFSRVAPEDLARVTSQIRRLTPESPVGTAVMRVSRPDGSDAWLDWTDRAFFDADGNVAEVQSVGRDISDLVAARAAREASRAELSATLSAIPDILYRHTIEGEVLAVHSPPGSDRASCGEVGSCVTESLPPEAARLWLEKAGRVANDGGMERLEYSLVLPSGRADFEARIVSAGREEILTIVRDVTDLVRERAAKERARELFRAAWDQSPISIVVVMPDGRISFVNEAAVAPVGLTPEAVRGRSWLEVAGRLELTGVDGERVPRSRFPIADALRGESRRGEEFVLRVPGEEPRTILVDATPVLDVDGAMMAAVSVTQDVTDLKREAAGRAAIDRLFRTFFEQVAAGAVAFEFDGRIRMINPMLKRLLGLKIDPEGSSLFDLMDPQTRFRSEELVRGLASGAIDQYWREERFLRPDGEALSVHSSVNLVRGLDGQPEYAIGLIQDLSATKRLEREVLDVAVRERERLGRDLHDGLGQELTAVALLAKALERRLAEGSGEGADRAREIGQVAQAALSQTRFLAKGLSSMALDGGIGDALADLASNATDLFSVPVDVRVSEVVPILDHETAAHLYQICREAVTNAVRHGEAGRIDVELISDESRIALTVTDDGRGIPIEEERSEGLGLKNMRFRARQVGGRLSVSRRAEAGTSVEVLVVRREPADSRDRSER